MNLPLKILLLGAGELGKEFVISAKRLGCYTIACDNYQGAPAHQVSDKQEVLDMLNEKALKRVVGKHNPDIIVPEIEAIRTEALLDFEAQGIQVVPSARAVNYTMNRDRIRDLVSNELNIRTARFGYSESQEGCKIVASEIGYPLVIKPVMSSSGKGQSVVGQESEIAEAWHYACEGMRGDRKRVIIEEFIDFQLEVTLLTVRQKSGKSIFCPLIGHLQERGDYQESWQPVDMDEALLSQAHKIADKVTSNLGGVGIFGVELFITENEIIFSELSPRPHDTGMVTLISQNLSQFDLHARSILGLPIPEIEFYGPSASKVILSDQYSESVSYTGIPDALAIPNVDIRIFGKQTARPNRRMAVCLSRGSTVKEARQKVDNATRAVTLIYNT